MQAPPQLIVDSKMISGIALGELGSQTLPLGRSFPGGPPPNAFVERLWDRSGILGPSRHITSRAEILAERTIVDPGDGRPGGLKLAQCEGRFRVDGRAVAGRRRGKWGGHLGPDVHEGVLPLGNINSWHRPAFWLGAAPS